MTVHSPTPAVAGELRLTKDETHKRICTKINKHAESGGSNDCDGKRR